MIYKDDIHEILKEINNVKVDNILDIATGDGAFLKVQAGFYKEQCVHSKGNNEFLLLNRISFFRRRKNNFSRRVWKRVWHLFFYSGNAVNGQNLQAGD